VPSVLAAVVGVVAIVSGLLIGASRHLGGSFAGAASMVQKSASESALSLADFRMGTSVLPDASFVLSLALVTVGGMLVVATITVVVLSRRRRSPRV